MDHSLALRVRLRRPLVRVAYHAIFGEPAEG